MKRWIALLMALLMAAVSTGALAQSVITGPRGPELPSNFEVDPDAGMDTATQNGATMGTDVYLFVDPDSASYVTFYVYNDDGENVPNAVITISCNGTQCIYGITDAHGKCSMYLFRDQWYGYLVTADGHTAQDGAFTPTDEAKEVQVMLRKYHTLTVHVLRGGKPVLGALIRINGEEYLTNDQGIIIADGLVKGNYDMWIFPPGGGSIYRKARIRGDTVMYVYLDDYGEKADDELEGFEGGFLVYNKLYEPEDYVLTEYDHKPLDVLRKASEDDESYQQRKQRYLDENPNTIVVQAQPEREQLTTGDRDLTNPDGTLLYAQRSMMPAGSLLRNWEQQGYTRVLFTNEQAGLSVDLADLHSPAMTKAFALARALGSNQLTSVTATGHELTVDPDHVDVTAIDWNAVRPFEFNFDHELETANATDRASHQLLPDSLYQETVFEFRITPVLPQELLRLVQEGAAEKAEPDLSVIQLTSADAEEAKDEQRKADGLLTADEDKALYALFVQDQPAQDMTAEQLVEAAVSGKMVRVSCWIHSNGVEMDVTALLDSLQVMWDANEAFQNQLEQLPKNEMTEWERVQAACEAMEEQIRMMSMDSQNELAVDTCQVQAVRGKPVSEEELYATLNRKLYKVYTVDVRREKEAFTSVMEEGIARRKEAYGLMAPSNVSGLVWLNEAE